MPQPSYDVRVVGDTLDDYCSIAAEGLLASDPTTWNLYVERVGAENLRGVFAGSRLAGGLAFYQMGQWFGGQRLDTAGYSGVAINPADRGQGACGHLLRETLRENYEQGFAIASLFASTQALYRTVGFEHAGMQTEYSIPISSLGKGDRSLPAHRFTEPPIDKLEFVAQQRARVSNGNLARNDGLWQRLIHPYDGHGTTTYLFGDLAAPEGFVILRSARRDGGVPQALVSTDVAANSPAALARLTALIHDHRSMCNRFVWCGPPNDPLHFVADEQFIEVPECMRWMLRVLNVSQALTLRGYPVAVSETLHLQIEDPLFSENDGNWTFSIEQGQPSIQRGGEGSLRMNIRGLAPLFSGLFSATELVGLGAIQCDDREPVQAADRVFAGPTPWLVEVF